jgi:hypothetical protein
MAADQVSQTDVDSLNQELPAKMGIYVKDKANIREVTDALVAGTGVWYVPDAFGVLRFGRLARPSEPPAVDIIEPMLDGVPRWLRSSDEGGGQPAWKVTVKGRRHWMVHDSTTVAQSLSEARQNELTEEWRRAVAEDASIKTGYPDAVEIEIETALHELADMQTEADRLLALYRTRQQFVEITLASRHVPSLWVGDSVRFIYPRFDLADGGTFVVMRKLVSGIKTTLELWRPLDG